ncbi:MAG: N-6 DNA methylase [Ignavibacteria bacterium GWB2_35_12]|nr:MAG: N-6 DNA methylase [Ignavibacteria bacterium GWA2_35_8]OGU40061.1 MAG: N-6 DNA methylase [Ignavibacteria bacterium GWB2_35_12]OGU94004.1 MAG: N-6 DNA methylase [Ignavibacteria bacterium RIFOXYA2_FULL_35_10]OGV22861.1 MAG: N-6 DNA methylase [Ignavibacteria bacterium RIFOXYC2_FULL_35_21]
MHESTYIDEIPLNHRKDYGQYFTPPNVARIMANWIMKHNPQTILDPAFGLGIFYDEIKKINSLNYSKFIGYEIDSKILTYIDYNSNKNITLLNNDYLESDIGKFDGIICNPPYMRFQKFLNRHNVLPIIEQKIGKKLVGYSNIASVFLVKSLSELNKNGKLAYIMPLEFFNTGYGKEIKKSLLENHLLKHIIIFENEKEIFPDATTTVCILLCSNDDKNENIKITLVKSEEEINNKHDVDNLNYFEIKINNLPFNKKWSPIFLSFFSEQKIPEGFTKVSLYGSFKRGIATGANDFFALTKSDLIKYKISNNNICKCITKSSQLKNPVFTEDYFHVLYNNNKPVYCLDIKDHNEQSIIDYLKLGVKRGVNTRYLTKTRNPWYRIENRKPAPILFGVFSRGHLKVIRNYSTAINFTCFHSFYPNFLFGGNEIDKLFVYFLSDIGQAIIKLNKRVYGENLDKLEPGDLNDCFCPNLNQFALIRQEEAEKVIEIAKTNQELAVKMSNELIERIIK